MDNIETTETLHCKCCSNSVKETDLYCQTCGFPLKGGEEEQKQFIYNRDYKHLELKELNRKIKNAGTTLYVLAGLFTLLGVIYYFTNKENEQLALAVLLTNVILSAIFLALASWSKKKPAAAIISGLVLYVLVQLIAIIEDPANIVKGIILKVIIIIYLIKGMQSALEAEKIKKQHNLS